MKIEKEKYFKFQNKTIHEIEIILGMIYRNNIEIILKSNRMQMCRVFLYSSNYNVIMIREPACK